MKKKLLFFKERKSITVNVWYFMHLPLLSLFMILSLEKDKEISTILFF